MRKCKNWLDTYMEYTHNQESPVRFHKWTGLAVLAVCLERRVWIPRIKYILYPNLYIILVAESAVCRKSTAVSMGKQVLKGLVEPPQILAQKMTPEALIEALEMTKLKGTSAGFLCCSELISLLGRDSMKSGLIPVLTDIYDCHDEWEYRTRSKGKETLKNIYVNMLAATTKKNIYECIPSGAIGGGFTSRVIFVYESMPSKLILFNETDAFGNEIVESPKEVELRSKLVSDLTHIKSVVNGQVRFSSEAKKVSEEWYQTDILNNMDENLDGYFGRKHDIMFKLATLLSICESDSLIIEANHIKDALKLLKETETGASIVAAAIPTSETGSLNQKIFDIIKKTKSISHSDLLRKAWRLGHSAELCAAIKTLIDSGDIIEGFDGKTRIYTYNTRESS